MYGEGLDPWPYIWSSYGIFAGLILAYVVYLISHRRKTQSYLLTLSPADLVEADQIQTSKGSKL
jgi:hypothetical protein